MTGYAVAIGKGTMHILILGLQFIVTGKTAVGQTPFYEPFAHRPMGIVTGKTLSLPHRLMHPAFQERGGFPAMTGVTELICLI